MNKNKYSKDMLLLTQIMGICTWKNQNDQLKKVIVQKIKLN